MSNKESAIQFLSLIVEGRIDEAYDQFVVMEGKHHNIFFKAGFPALREAMKENHSQFPHKQYDIQHILVDGEMVVVHAKLVPAPGTHVFSQMHLFRFEGGKIAQLWDFSQEIPEKIANSDGAF